MKFSAELVDWKLTRHQHDSFQIYWLAQDDIKELICSTNIQDYMEYVTQQVQTLALEYTSENSLIVVFISSSVVSS